MYPLTAYVAIDDILKAYRFQMVSGQQAARRRY
jgi:hypothetical protein